jgi:heavy metal sensor kinase
MPRRAETYSPQAEGDNSPAAPRKSANPFGSFRTRGEFRELFGFTPFGDCFLVGHSMAPDLAAMRRLALWLAAAGSTVLVLGLAGGWWVASRAIRPIEDISATALKIFGGDLSQRINAADTDSELGRLAAVLNATFARLEAAFAHQSRFTSDASHELRTPVSVILTQTQTALSRQRSENEYREALEACQRAATRMRRLTESLLELARLDAGEERMKRERFDLSRIARECVELVRPLAVERGLQLECDLPEVECVGDPERIAQVATNLLSNAIHFNREHGQIRIATQADNGTVLLSVSDTGVGIPNEDLPHIFERFYRVDKSRSRIHGRTGLGLAITKAIVDAHSGTVEVSSQAGQGSRFTVKLPSK